MQNRYVLIVREWHMAPIYSSSVISISKITLRTLKQASSTDTVLSLMSAPSSRCIVGSRG